MPLTEYLLRCNHWGTDNHHRDLHKPHILRALQQVSDIVVVWEWRWGHYHLCGFPHGIFTTSRNSCKTVSLRAIFSPPLMLLLIINGWKGELKSIHICVFLPRKPKIPHHLSFFSNFFWFYKLIIREQAPWKSKNQSDEDRTKKTRRNTHKRRNLIKSALSCFMGS